MEIIKTQKRLEHDEVETYINSYNGNILLNKEDYIKNSIRNLKVVCGFCGEVFTVSLSSYQSGKQKCSKCTKRESSGEYKIRSILEENKIDYEPQKRFEDCIDKRSLPFDFYLPSYNLCIEYQGAQHYEPNAHFKNFDKLTLHDNIKKQYCKKNNIKLLCIPYWENNIENLILNNLK